jgi:hypothetical protein
VFVSKSGFENASRTADLVGGYRVAKIRKSSSWPTRYKRETAFHRLSSFVSSTMYRSSAARKRSTTTRSAPKSSAAYSDTVMVNDSLVAKKVNRPADPRARGYQSRYGQQSREPAETALRRSERNKWP